MNDTADLLVLANAAAGSAEDEAVEAAVEELRRGARVEVVVPDGPDETREVLRGAAGRGVVVMGGDGSVHTAVATLVELGMLDDAGPVGIIPLGTGNDLARALGLPLDPREAARVVLNGRTRRLDLLRDDAGGVAVNAVHAGVGAEATARAEDVKGVLGVTAYAIGAVRAGMATAGWRLRVVVDGEVAEDGSRRLLMVTVGNGRTIGGGTPIAPLAATQDGLADVVVSSATGPIARAGFALALRRGRHLARRDVALVRGREVTVEAAGPDDAFRLNADGDVSGPVRRRTWTVAPSAWACLVPTDR